MRTKKTILLSLLTALLVCALCGCGKYARLRFVKKSAESTGDVTGELKKVVCTYNPYTEHSLFDLTYAFTNETDAEISYISYDLVISDKAGTEIDRMSWDWKAENDALAAGETVTVQDGFQDAYNDNVGSVTLVVTGYGTPEENPVAQLPKVGEPLYLWLKADMAEDNPVKILLHIDEGGYGQDAEITDPEVIADLTEKFCAVTVREETNMSVTDNYNSVTFTFADGTEKVLPFELQTLCVNAGSGEHHYELDNLSPFWTGASAFLESYGE